MAQFNLDQINADNLVIFLDGKIIKTAIAVDTVEGWVEIPDLMKLAPLKETSDIPFEESPSETPNEIPTKRLFGKVQVAKPV